MHLLLFTVIVVQTVTGFDYYSCGLSTATIEYSPISVCVCVC